MPAAKGMASAVRMFITGPARATIIRWYRGLRLNISLGGISDAPIIGPNYEPGWEIGRIRNTNDLQTNNIEYFVMTNYYQNFLAEKERYPNQVATYEKLMRQATLVYDVESIPGVSRGPRVRIYRLTTEPSVTRSD